MFQRRVIEEHDEEESIFISMTDLSVSMLLLLVILLGFFASQYRQASLLEQETANTEQIAALRVDISSLEQRLANADPDGAIRETLQQRLARESAETARVRASLEQALADLSALRLSAEQDRARAGQEIAGIAQDREEARATALLRQQQLNDAMAVRDAENQTLLQELRLREETIASLRQNITALEQRLAGADPDGAIRETLRERLARESATTALLSASLEQALAEREALQAEAARLSLRLQEETAVRSQEQQEAGEAVIVLQQQVNEAAAARDAAVQDFVREVALREAQWRHFEAQIAQLEAGMAVERDRSKAEIAGLSDRVAELEQNLSAALAQSVEAVGKSSDDEALAIAQARIQEIEAVLEEERLRADRAIAAEQVQQLALLASEQRHDVLQLQVMEQDAEIATLRAQLSALEALLGSLMSSTTSLLEKLNPGRGGEQATD